jgi:hypothetical protein
MEQMQQWWARVFNSKQAHEHADPVPAGQIAATSVDAPMARSSVDQLTNTDRTRGH